MTNLNLNNLSQTERESLIAQIRSATTSTPGTYVDVAGDTMTGALALESTLQVGTSGTALTQVRVFGVTLSPAAVANATTSVQTFLVNGVNTSDKVFVNPPTFQGGLGIIGARASGASVLAIHFINQSAATVTPDVGLYNIVAVRS